MKLTFELARLEHAKAIERMRNEASMDLTTKIGIGHWSGKSRVASIRERIELADPTILRHRTIYVATRDGEAVGSVVVSTYPIGFWKKEYWQDPAVMGLGAYGLTVFPSLQGQGVGRFLMEEVEQLARDHLIPFVRLDAYLANPFSTAFYRKLGYEERREIDVRGVRLILFEKRV
ncbi:MAG: GNAT family N-acetyltransferase [Chlorobia bacterium]|nr:GNAT family N-acetyltransferase [Fimbriimonadaceae bacterium]